MTYNILREEYFPELDCARYSIVESGLSFQQATVQLATLREEWVQLDLVGAGMEVSYLIKEA